MRDDGVAYCLDTACGQVVEVRRLYHFEGGGQGMRVYDSSGLSTTISALGGGWGAKTGLYDVGGFVRRLTPRECARLQGFPESYKIEVSDAQAYKQFGNTVTVPVVEAVGRQLKRYFEGAA